MDIFYLFSMIANHILMGLTSFRQIKESMNNKESIFFEHQGSNKQCQTLYVLQALLAIWKL